MNSECEIFTNSVINQTQFLPKYNIQGLSDGQSTLKYLNSQLRKLADFLSPILPLVNSHLVNFFVDDQFNTLLNPRLRFDLMELRKKDLDLIPLANLSEQSIGKYFILFSILS